MTVDYFFKELTEDEKNTGQYVRKDLNIDEVISIFSFILNKKYENSKDVIVKILARGTVEAYFNEESWVSNDLIDYQLIYRLDNAPVNYSHHISVIEMKYGSLYIESSGDDPNFLIPDYISKEKDINVKISITTTSSVVIELFYISDNVNFDKDHSVRRFLKKGFNEFTIRLNESAPISKLRLDPGNKEGIYIIHSFEVYRRKQE